PFPSSSAASTHAGSAASRHPQAPRPGSVYGSDRGGNRPRGRDEGARGGAGRRGGGAARPPPARSAPPDRILDRRGEDGGHWERARFADTLEPQWVQGRECLEVVDDHGRHVGGGGQQVVHV